MSPDISINEKTQIPLFYSVSMLFAAGSVFIAWGQLGAKIEQAVERTQQVTAETAELRKAVVQLQSLVSYQQARLEQCVVKPSFRGVEP